MDDIEMKQNEATLLANILYRSETKLAYSRTWNGRREANSGYLFQKWERSKRCPATAYYRIGSNQEKKVAQLW
jgi:hypothetical protein